MVKMDITFKGRVKEAIRSCTFNDIKVHLVLLSVCLIFSVFYIITKKTLNEIPPFVFLMFRLAIATPCLWICAFAIARKEMLILPTKKEFALLALSGFLSVTVNQSLFLLGLDLSTASNAAITQPAIPVFSTIFGVILGFERKTKLKFAGITIAVIGTVLMVDFTHLTSETSTSKDILLGNLCFLGNTIAYAIFLMVQKPLQDGGISAIKCISWSFLFGSPPVILISLLTTNDISAQSASITLWPWMAILYCAILATAYCFFASSWSVGKSNVVTVAVYLCVEPFATGILATIFLDEILTPLNIVGGVIMIIGVAAVMVSKYREEKKDQLDKFEKEKLKTYDMNNTSIELSSINNNNHHHDIGSTSINETATAININDNNKKNSYSKIITSNSIISEDQEDEDDSDNNNNQDININHNNNNYNNYNNNNSNINHFNNNHNFNHNNNLLNQFKQVQNNDSDNEDIELNDSIDRSSDSVKGGGSILVF